MLAAYLVAGSALARNEAALAAGIELRGESMGRTVESADCKVTILDVQPADDGVTASVGARAVTTLTWRTAAGKTDVEASGIDHTITLSRERRPLGGHGGRVHRRPARGVPGGRGRRACPGARRCPRAASAGLSARRCRRPRRPGAPIPARRYTDIIEYDRPAAQAYADTYCLSYNPTFVRFAGADCANFASQCARAGSMPQQRRRRHQRLVVRQGRHLVARRRHLQPELDQRHPADELSGTARRTDWETSAGVLSRGDFIYYDWSGDGVWDHVAVVAGTNSAGQKVIDAHTTDHYRVFWKLGYSGTKYKFARTRVSWII